MAKKKAKNRKKPTKTRASIKTSGASRGPVKETARHKIVKKKPSSEHKTAKRKPALKQAKTKTRTKTKTAGKKATAAKRPGAPKKQVPKEREILDLEPFELEKRRSESAGQAGDLQGLSDTEGADSESVEELLEEGNAFEAGVVAGVESAGSPREVRTHELPEDDVPGEYLDGE